MIGAFGDMLMSAIAGSLVGFTGDMLGMGMSNAANLQAIRETNAANAKNIAATNEANLEQVRLTNAANAEQANLAYQRSLPVNQVRDLMDAGMSKAGALTKLAGGGVYTPPALQAGTSQASTAQAPHFDYSGIAQAFERLGSIPANQIQLQYNREQLNALREDVRIKQAAEERARQKHEYDMWREQYGKDTAQLLDSVSSKISDALLQSGKDISEFKSFESLLRGLNMTDDKDIKRMPHLARTQIFDAVRDKFAENRAQEQRSDEHTAAEDAHRLSLLRESLARVDVKYYDKEKHERLLNLMREGEGLVQKNNLTFAELTAQNMENFVREAGINDEADAQALAAYAERLANDDEAMQQMYQYGLNHSVASNARRGLRQVLRDFGELLKSVRLSGGKYSVTKNVKVTR